VKPPQSYYRLNDMVGKSTTQIGRTEKGEFHSDDSEVYEKWAQAVSSAYDLISDAAYSFRDSESQVIAHFIVPVVVPDQMLWAVDYSEQGEILREPILHQEVTFYLGHSPWKIGQMFSYTVSHLHFVTPSGLSSLIDNIIGSDAYAGKIFPSARLSPESKV
jgi:hypothetical protein